MSMKVRYVGPNLGAMGLTNNKIYECIGVKENYLRIIDDEEEDYLYPAKEPFMMDKPDIRGKFEIVEDDENGTLDKAINGCGAEAPQSLPSRREVSTKNKV